MRTLSGRRLILVSALVLAACASPRAGSGTSPSTTNPAPACTAAAPLPEGLLQASGVVLFGEIHGTQEIPSFFGEEVCAAAASPLPIEVGLEVMQSEQTRVDAFLASAGTEADIAALTSGAFWTRDMQDGRSSRAMLGLLDRLRQLKAQGAPLHVFLFDSDDFHNQAERDKGMADNIAAHVRSHPDAVTMALTGEVHAWKTKGAGWDPEFLPMGLHLAGAGVHVVSLGRATPSGTVWTCQGPSPDDCGANGIKPFGAMPSGGTAGIELLPAPGKHGYDGMYATPTLTASPPARSEHGARG